MALQLELQEVAAAIDRGEWDAGMDHLGRAIENELFAQLAAGNSVDDIDLSRLFEGGEG